jgi:triacylglycerol lipase
VSTDASTIPRLGLPLTPPHPRVVGEFLSTYDSERWPAAPAGEGRPVMLIPGFMAGDQSLTRMAVWLRTGGFVLARSGIRWNSGCMEATVETVERRLLVDTLVTLGSPLRDQLAVRPRVWPSILTVGTLGTFGVPGMFSVRCINGQCCARSREALTAPFPESIRFVSIYSPSDEVVRWEACLDPAATQIEVDVSHLGMGMAREVWLTVAGELGETVTPTV